MIWKRFKKDHSSQTHLAQDHPLRIALIVNGVHESKIRFTFQLGVNYLILWRVKSSDCWRADCNVLLYRFFTPKREMYRISRSPYRWGIEYEVENSLEITRWTCRNYILQRWERCSFTFLKKEIPVSFECVYFFNNSLFILHPKSVVKNCTTTAKMADIKESCYFFPNQLNHF